uniref:Uncharacterized protein n=1 Tax=Panagrolaimus sp. ES5 TaxID=591445 RepID=A0AC34G5T4_9BILA
MAVNNHFHNCNIIIYQYPDPFPHEDYQYQQPENEYQRGAATFNSIDNNDILDTAELFGKKKLKARNSWQYSGSYEYRDGVGDDRDGDRGVVSSKYLEELPPTNQNQNRTVYDLENEKRIAELRKNAPKPTYFPPKDTFEVKNEKRIAELRKNAPKPTYFPPKDTFEERIKDGLEFADRDECPTYMDAPSDCWDPTPEELLILHNSKSEDAFSERGFDLQPNVTIISVKKQRQIYPRQKPRHQQQQQFHSISDIVAIGTFLDSRRGGFIISFNGSSYNCTIKLKKFYIGRIVAFRCNKKGCRGRIYVRVPEYIGIEIDAPLIGVQPHTNQKCLDS